LKSAVSGFICKYQKPKTRFTMKKKFIMLCAVLACVTTSILAQDQPRKCQNQVTPFDEIIKGKIKSQVKTAHTYYMTSTDPAAGSNYEERTNNLNREIMRTFQAFMSARRMEYRQVECNYFKEDWNKPGNHSKRTLTVLPGFYLLKETLKRTQNGDWKGGPAWKPNTDKPRSITWKTGGHRRSKTFVDIMAKYHESHIRTLITAELNQVRRELNDQGIPTELPPFLEG